jgi:hypothetical protein
MFNARIDTTRDFVGNAVVHACFDLGPEELAAAAHAVGAIRVERFRDARMEADDVVALRELTALVDELVHHGAQQAATTLVLSPARLGALRGALEAFVAERDAAEFLRGEDREPLAGARALIDPIATLCGDAMRAALSAPLPSAH